MGWKDRPTARSVPCNGALIKEYRRSLGLTQDEFASVAGYTKRLIAKAEASQSVRPDTIEVLADALSSPSKIIHPEDLVCRPKDIVRHIIESFAKHERQCVAHCHQFLSESMTVVAPGPQEIFPFAGVHQTIDGFDDFWGKYFTAMERFDKLEILNSMQLVAEGNLVVALVREAACHRSGNSPKYNQPFPLTFIFEFERGKVSRFDDHFDVTSALRQLEHARQLGGLGNAGA